MQIEQHDVRRGPTDERQELWPLLRLTHDLDVRLVFERRSKGRQHQLVVVRDDQLPPHVRTSIGGRHRPRIGRRNLGPADHVPCNGLDPLKRAVSEPQGWLACGRAPPRSGTCVAIVVDPVSLTGMRISTVLIVVCAAAGIVFGAYFVGHAVDEPGEQLETVLSEPAQAASRDGGGESGSRPCRPRRPTEFDHGTYAGMTTSDLRSYDKRLAPGVSVRRSDPTAPTASRAPSPERPSASGARTGPSSLGAAARPCSYRGLQHVDELQDCGELRLRLRRSSLDSSRAPPRARRSRRWYSRVAAA